MATYTGELQPIDAREDGNIVVVGKLRRASENGGATRYLELLREGIVAGGQWLLRDIETELKRML